MENHADESLIRYTHIIYGLHALSVLIGITSAVTIVGSFVFGLPSLIAVIMNYLRRGDVRGTFLESHFQWQIRTFWGGMLLAVVVWLVSLPLMLILVGFATLYVGTFVIGLWIAYRVIRGWLNLRDGRAMYA